MKTLLILLTALLTSTSFAAECVNAKGEDLLSDPEAFQALIEKASSCWQAKELAHACAWGSSLDVRTAGLAYDVCEKSLNENKPAANLVSTLTTMKNLCTEKYENEDGTMYRSMNAFCHLDAIDFILNLAIEN